MACLPLQSGTFLGRVYEVIWVGGAVLCLVVAAAATIVYATVLTVQVVTGPTTTRALILGVIAPGDLLLVGTAPSIIALGLYERFFDQHFPSPPWPTIRDLDDLKARVLGG